MDKKTIKNVIILFLGLHGLIEITAFLALFVPSELLPEAIIGEDFILSSILSIIYGTCRIITALGIRSRATWAFYFAIFLSIVTFILAPNYGYFGVMDLIFATITIIGVLFILFPEKIIFNDK
ncbi:MAG: hypothetical protein EAX89_17105 [Candidatus Lokiarchaeota archaeon]|nr:hypothetical protein [Candidatus Lokiarchaeota archaeon]